MDSGSDLCVLNFAGLIDAFGLQVEALVADACDGPLGASVVGQSNSNACSDTARGQLCFDFDRVNCLLLRQRRSYCPAARE